MDGWMRGERMRKVPLYKGNREIGTLVRVTGGQSDPSQHINKTFTGQELRFNGR